VRNIKEGAQFGGLKNVRIGTFCPPTECYSIVDQAYGVLHAQINLGTTFFVALVAASVASAQGTVRGAQDGAEAGGQAAGPVGAIVGGSVGAATGTVGGILGVPPTTPAPDARTGSERSKQGRK
jgi:hypothetical protein